MTTLSKIAGLALVLCAGSALLAYQQEEPKNTQETEAAKKDADAKEPEKAKMPDTGMIEKPAEPEKTKASTVSGDPPTAEDVLRKLREQKPSNEAIMPVSATSGAGPASAAPGRNLLPEGHVISRRPGRLVRDGQWWTFVFESDSPDHPEPRLRLLPCLSLEQMVRATENATMSLVFVVSGEVTVYDAENYLLARSAQRRIDGGNLTK